MRFLLLLLLASGCADSKTAQKTKPYQCTQYELMKANSGMPHYVKLCKDSKK